MATMDTGADVLERSAALTRVSLTLCRHKAATIQLHVERFYIWDQERQALTS